MKHSAIDGMTAELDSMKDELARAVDALDERYHSLRESARRRLGSLYNPADYPDTLRGTFSVSWDFPSLDPPAYLATLNPTLYAEQSARVAARFDRAVQLAEEEFIGQLAKMVDHLQEKLTGLADGTAKRFYDTEITNITDFFQRFRTLNLHSSAELDALIDRARRPSATGT